MAQTQGWVWAVCMYGDKSIMSADMYDNYSVLMSVYKKEKPEYLRQAIESMQNQTVATNDFVCSLRRKMR